MMIILLWISICCLNNIYGSIDQQKIREVYVEVDNKIESDDNTDKDTDQYDFITIFGTYNNPFCYQSL